MDPGGAPPSPRGIAGNEKRRQVVPIGFSLEQLVLQSNELSMEEKEVFAKQITPRSKTPQLPEGASTSGRASNQGEASSLIIGSSRKSAQGETSSLSGVVAPIPAPPARKPPPVPPIDAPLTPRSRALAHAAGSLRGAPVEESTDHNDAVTPRSRRPEGVRLPGSSPLPSPLSSPRGKPLPPVPIADLDRNKTSSPPPPSPSETLTPRSRAEGSRLHNAVSSISSTASDSLALMSPRSIGQGIGRLLGSLSADDGGSVGGGGASKKDDKSEQLYAFHLALSRKEDLAPVAALQVIFPAGVDHLKRPVIVCLAENIPKQRYDLDLLLLQAIAVMHPIVDQEFVFVYVHSRHLAAENKPKLSWLRKVNATLTRKYKKNLKAFFVINWTFGVKMTLKMCKPFISRKFFKKVKYLSHSHEIFKFIDKDQLHVPDHLLIDKKELPPPPPSQPLPVFGVSLVEAARRRAGVNGLPQVFEACIAYLATTAPDTEGIFRISGTSSNIDVLRKSYDKGMDVELSLVENVHDVASLLKLYLRELPEPLFPYVLYNSLLSLVRDNPGGYRVWSSTLKVLLNQVPSINRLALEHLMQLLNAVAGHSLRNKMTASNLAIVFGPNILRSQTESLEALVTDAPFIGQFITALIMYHADVFA